mmetsp:Transcript_1333/g.1739  ORF Transcript_1333/g.1739 Transcript_1333/m.1739 type:complete len:264 (+) Transcript_1333:114-905(+)|eukprot:CAMPEP_0178918906 /NCGR_PEP_ID=MMETSP0786-20121207/14101_1 /TAXON_ID=186022 /ORGANISM="Thalassionema frauenfeldii, Strain CCMP 1798" /LENGTH=263 /DNA_ID=CAMNT_0020592697 /DNA_START=20 /DNA_END=811 /DNA_ORIENTATION=+
MALVNVNNILVLDNPTLFTNPFQFEITFECLQELEDDLEWKVIYVGKAADCESDLVLEEVLVGPVPVGINKFVLEADPPPHTSLGDELLGVTVVLVTCSYREREFVRIGYYVNNMMEGYNPEEEEAAVGYDENDSNNNKEEAASGEARAPAPKPKKTKPKIEISKVTRQILADKPRVTKFPIPWGDTSAESNTQPPQPQNIPDDEDDNILEDKDMEGDDDDDDDDEEEDEPEGEEGEEAEEDGMGISITENNQTNAKMVEASE